MQFGVSSRSLWEALKRKFDSLAVWILTPAVHSLLASISTQRASVQVCLGYDKASPGTTQASRCSSALAADARRDRALPSCLQAKQPADVDDHREEIVRPIASKSAIALTPRIPHS